MVSDRERELQKQFGYPVDKVPYWKFCELDRSPGGKIGGKLVGKMNTESQKIQREQWKILGWKTRARNGGLTNNVIVECPHCGKTGKRIGLIRWHFEKCKNKN